jgi:hypothetical protein
MENKIFISKQIKNIDINIVNEEMDKLIKIIVAIIVGGILWYCATLAIAAIHAPAIVGTLVLILFLLALAMFIWQLFIGKS